MSEALSYPRFDFDDYLAWELRYPDTKWELDNGVPVAIIGGSIPHARAASRLIALLAPAATAHGCDVLGSDAKLRVSMFRSYYPDVAVYCDPTDNDDRYRERPCLVVEVLCPSSRVLDSGPKATAYLSIPTAKAYLIVDGDDRSITVHTRDSLHRYEGDDQVITLDCPLVHSRSGSCSRERP